MNAEREAQLKRLPGAKPVAPKKSKQKPAKPGKDNGGAENESTNFEESQE